MTKIKITAQELADKLDLIITCDREGAIYGWEQEPEYLQGTTYAWNHGIVLPLVRLDDVFDVDFSAFGEDCAKRIAFPTPDFQPNDILEVWDDDEAHAQLAYFVNMLPGRAVRVRFHRNDILRNYQFKHARLILHADKVIRNAADYLRVNGKGDE